MFPLRLVIDTNVLVSAALKPTGLQRTVLLLALTKPARLYVSPPIQEEYSEVLARPDLKIAKGLRQQLLQLIKNHSHIVVRTQRLHVTSDPDDNIIFGMCRCRPRGLSGHGESKALPEILEEDQGDNAERVHFCCLAASLNKRLSHGLRIESLEVGARLSNARYN